MQIKVELYPRAHKPKKEGLYFVKFRVYKDGKTFGHDWGFSEFKEGNWVALEAGGMVTEVLMWGNLPDPNPGAQVVEVGKPVKRSK